MKTAVSRLPAECSAALTFFLINSWAALALLSEVHRKRQINDRELIVAVLVGFIPKGLNNMLIFSLPVALRSGTSNRRPLHIPGSALQPLCGWHWHPCREAIALSQGADIGSRRRPRTMVWMGGYTKTGLREGLSSSINIIKVLVPTIFFAQVAIEYVLVLPIVERYNSLVEPLDSRHPA